ncbi:MAG: nucleotide exchange factor GrpE [Patescibacteria group bacterium]
MEEDIKNNKKEEEKESELEVCMKKCDEYLEGWKRAKADFLNYKKEEAGRISELMKFGNESIMFDLITVLDSFNLGISLSNDETAKKGMLLIKTQLEDILKRYGLEKISIERGGTFDPKTQEAVDEIISDYPEGTVAEELEKGYTLSGKVIRPIKVKLSKGNGG